ncbi:MAG: hypothetical protein K0S53_377 [Bacteroidetes bacterium]|jgi:hypothetical protein|nr:hypothetical protein [Bacteroidota bacterium]
MNNMMFNILEKFRPNLEIHTHNEHEVDIVAINLGENKIMVNHEEPYLLNQNPVVIPNKLNDLFKIETKNGKSIVKLTGVQLNDLMDAFQEIHDKERN